MNQAFSPAKILAQVKVLVPKDRQAEDIPRKFSMAKTAAARRKIEKEPVSYVGPPSVTFLKAWRKKKGVTQQELAADLGVSNGTVSQVENGETEKGYHQTYLEAVSRRLEVHVCDLLFRDPDEPETIWALWDRASREQRRHIVGMVNGYLNTPRGS